MTNTLPRKVVAGEVASVAPPRWLAVVSVGVGAVALVGAFVPFATISAGVLALIGLLLGVFCLIRDPGLNRLAVCGSMLSSAAVTAAIVMTIVYVIVGA